MIFISDVDEEGTSLTLLGGVRLHSTDRTDSTDELCRISFHASTLESSGRRGPNLFGIIILTQLCSESTIILREAAVNNSLTTAVEVVRSIQSPVQVMALGFGDKIDELQAHLDTQVKNVKDMSDKEIVEKMTAL